jgi:hypothetical protein
MAENAESQRLSRDWRTSSVLLTTFGLILQLSSVAHRPQYWP